MDLDEFIPFYLKAHYAVDGFLHPIQIGELSQEADLFIAETGHYSWLYITAYNPFSEVFSEEENKALNQILENELKQYPCRKGKGIDPDANWPGEESFLAAGITREKAIELAIKYRQNAVVFGEAGKPAELLINRQIQI